MRLAETWHGWVLAGVVVLGLPKATHGGVQGWVEVVDKPGTRHVVLHIRVPHFSSPLP